MIHLRSKQSVAETLQRLEALVQSKGLEIFCRVDHSGAAEKVGLAMKPTQLLIFGSPKAGTPVMQAAPSIAIDFPLKILIWEDKDRKVWVSSNSAAYLKERHAVPSDLLANIAIIETLATKVAE